MAYSFSDLVDIVVPPGVQFPLAQMRGTGRMKLSTTVGFVLPQCRRRHSLVVFILRHANAQILLATEMLSSMM